ncbi:hypothetical protein [Halomarina pelagica]|nr:hypothetical protein [Halomarina sp. BND7]
METDRPTGPTSESAGVVERTLNCWATLDRGWKAALFGVAIVCLHLSLA